MVTDQPITRSQAAGVHALRSGVWGAAAKIDALKGHTKYAKLLVELGLPAFGPVEAGDVEKIEAWLQQVMLDPDVQGTANGEEFLGLVDDCRRLKLWIQGLQ